MSAFAQSVVQIRYVCHMVWTSVCCKTYVGNVWPLLVCAIKTGCARTWIFGKNLLSISYLRSARGVLRNEKCLSHLMCFNWLLLEHGLF